MRYKREPVRKLNLNTFGQAVQGARMEKGMTQQELADKYGVNERTISMIESKSPLLSLQLFYEIATEFDLSVDEFFYPTKTAEISSQRRQLNALLDKLSPDKLAVVEATAKAVLTTKSIR